MAGLRTSIDEAILAPLCCKFRLAVLDQLVRLTGRSREVVERRARELLALDALEHRVVNAHPPIALETPIIRWSSGDATPSFHVLSYRARVRFCEAIRPTRVFIASPAALRLFGGKARKGLKHPLQATHDLHVTNIYLTLLETSPERAKNWIPEDLLVRAKPGEKHPDAIIAGNPPCVIDFINYGPSAIEKIHRHCERKGLDYELW